MASYKAQCSKVGSFSYADNFKLYVVLSDGEISGNSSKVNYDVYCQSSGSGSINSNHYKYFSINGQEIVNTTENINVSSPNAYIHIASGTTDFIGHDSDGNKSIHFYAEIRANSYGVAATLEGDFNLVYIPQGANFELYSITSYDLDTVDIYYKLDKNVSSVHVSVNEGEYIPVSTVSGDWSKDATARIYNLNPNTEYKFKIKATVNNIEVITNYMYVTTKDIAKITILENFNFGDNINLIKSNPSGNKNIIRVIDIDSNKNIKTIEDTSNNMNIEFTQDELDLIYKLLKNNNIKLRFYIDTIKNNKQWSSNKDVYCFLNGNAKTSHIHINENDKRAKLWINIEGVYKRAVAWIKVNNVWRRCI